MLGRISLALCWSTLTEVLEYWWVFGSVFDLLEGVFQLLSERFCGNLEGYRTSPNNLCAADTLLVALS